MNAIIYTKEGYSPDQINHFSQESMGIDPDSHIDSVIQATYVTITAATTATNTISNSYNT